MDDFLLPDTNCVQILVPWNAISVPPGNEVPGERVGNIAKEEASVLAEFMDDTVDAFCDSSLYNIDYKFTCILSENLNHKVDGYRVDIIVFTKNCDLWTLKLLQILQSKGVFAIKV